MNPKSLQDEFRDKVCAQVSLKSEGINRFRVLTPFRFEDGDHFGIVLKRETGSAQWIFTDEASTLMHLSYWMDDDDIRTGNRHDLIQGSLAVYSVEDRDGELVIPVSDGQFGDALFNFVQALTKVTDVSFLSRERVRSTFIEDFKNFIRANVPEDRLEFDWTEPNLDSGRNYPADCRINRATPPLLVYALPNDDKVKDATISLLKFETWNFQCKSLGIFEEQAAINRHTLARFTDICDKTFSSLDGDNARRIKDYLVRFLES
jgi:hypothetical protein